jgi:hypothetical protein
VWGGVEPIAMKAYTDASNPSASRCLANQSISGTCSQNLVAYVVWKGSMVRNGVRCRLSVWVWVGTCAGAKRKRAFKSILSRACRAEQPDAKTDRTWPSNSSVMP